MPKDIVAGLLDVLEEFRCAMTRPSFRNFVVLVTGWVLTPGTHAVTGALVATGMAGRRHHAAFHRFFSRASWNPDSLGFAIFLRLDRVLGEGPVRVAIDDTLAPHKGPRVFGLGSHLDPVRSTRLVRIFCFGHCWVVLSVLMHVPFSRRTWALPVLFRLYRNLKECEKHRAPYKKKTELARAMVDILCGWTAERRIEIAADSAYCNDTVTRALPERVVLFGAMRPDAVLTALPVPRTPGAGGGRPCKRGTPLPKPEAFANDGRRPWRHAEARLYGVVRTIRYKTYDAQWYRACGTRLVRIVIVATSSGMLPFRVFFSTDATLDVVVILETYAGRWAIEVFFREAKQLLGFADSSARKPRAVLRVAPFVGLLYSALVLWFLEGAHRCPAAQPPLRPWYPHKHSLTFEDILRAARSSFVQLDVSVPWPASDNLHHLLARSRKQQSPQRRLAA
jgi:hypothetical protein